MKTEIVYRCSDCKVDDIRKIMEGVGSRIGSVHFRKRSDGSLRKMCYRLHVQNPTYANSPKGQEGQEGQTEKRSQLEKVCPSCGRSDCPSLKFLVIPPVKTSSKAPSKGVIDVKNNQMTVFDVNKVIGKDETGKLKRGAWRTVSLESVERICVQGTVYEIAEIKV